MTIESVFSKRITYRKYLKEVNRITGDYDLNEHTDYTIFAEVQINMSSFQSNDSVGNIITTDGTLFTLGRYDTDALGNEIIGGLKPKEEDEIKFNGNWYKITNIEPVYVLEGEEIMWECTLVQSGKESDNEELNNY